MGFNLANLCPCAIEHVHIAIKWQVSIWRMVIKTPNSPKLIPSKITHYTTLNIKKYMYIVTAHSERGGEKGSITCTHVVRKAGLCEGYYIAVYKCTF